MLTAAKALVFARPYRAKSNERYRHDPHEHRFPCPHRACCRDVGAAGLCKLRSAPGMPPGVSLQMPEMDSKRGRQLFASKGCVTCHTVNGVGGHDASALDKHGEHPNMNPFDFAAQMWLMAPFMIAAQEEELGGQITFTGQELADIIAFVHDDGEQKNFSEDDIPANIRELMEHGHVAPGSEEHAVEIGHDE